LNNKTALVLGCSGQDGSLMCQSLLKKGHRVVGLTRLKKNKIQNHIKLKIDKDIEIIEGDIKSNKTIKDLIQTYQPETIFNLAAQSSVGKSFIAPMETIEGIVNGTANLLEVARKLKYKGHMFFAGSSEIFGNTSQKATIYHKQNPLSPYAISKQTSFNLVKLYRKIHKLNCITGILFNHESQLREKEFVTHKIITNAIESARNKNHTFTLGNIDVNRDWGWAEEYIEAIQIITTSKNKKDQIICTGKKTSLKEFIQITFELLNLDWKQHVIIDQNLFRKTEIHTSVGDPSEMINLYGWQAKKNVREIIKLLIEGHSETKI